MKSKPFWLFSIIFLVIYQISLVEAQPIPKTNNTFDNCTRPRINWIDEISSKSIGEQNSGFWGKVFEFLFGKEQISMARPFSSVTGNDGSVYIIDQDSKSLLYFDSKKDEIENLTKDNLLLKSPVSICVFKNGLLFTDSELNKVFRFDFESEEISEFCGSLAQPSGVTYIKNKDEVWVCETKNHRIVKFDKSGKVVGTIGKRGTEAGEFNFPIFIWSDDQGRVYINDSMNFRIQIFSDNGKFINLFGKSGDGMGDLARPKGIATDSFGHIYVADALFNNVQVFSQNGKLLTVIGEQGIEKGEFWLPSGVYINSENKIFVADSFNSRIQIFQLTCDDN